MPRATLAAADIACNGSASVMAFFVISGFCIHLPFASNKPLVVPAYLVRREVRILPPLLAMFLLGELTGHFGFLTVVWSLICEEIYYVLYPFARRFLADGGMRYALGASLVVWLVMVATNPKWSDPAIHAQGPWRTWLVCLPVWLVGACLADRYAKGERLFGFLPQPDRRRIWAWRIALFAISDAMAVILLNMVSEQIMMIPFGILACAWL
jgi:peptidoglycan/LPS O-acetylase OafA/YrhL